MFVLFFKKLTLLSKCTESDLIIFPDLSHLGPILPTSGPNPRFYTIRLFYQLTSCIRFVDQIINPLHVLTLTLRCECPQKSEFKQGAHNKNNYQKDYEDKEGSSSLTFTLPEKVGALGRALKIFEVSSTCIVIFEVIFIPYIL